MQDFIDWCTSYCFLGRRFFQEKIIILSILRKFLNKFDFFVNLIWENWFGYKLFDFGTRRFAIIASLRKVHSPNRHFATRVGRHHYVNASLHQKVKMSKSLINAIFGGPDYQESDQKERHCTSSRTDFWFAIWRIGEVTCWSDASVAKRRVLVLIQIDTFS